MATTRLSLNGVMGKDYTFLPKDAADEALPVSDIELTTEPYVQIVLTAEPYQQITLTAEPYVE